MSKATHWASHVSAWRASGASARQYCEDRGLKVSSLRYWSDRIRREQAEASDDAPADGSPKVRMAKVQTRPRSEPASGCQTSGIQIVVGTLRIEVPPSFDEETLLRVVRLLCTPEVSR